MQQITQKYRQWFLHIVLCVLLLPSAHSSALNLADVIKKAIEHDPDIQTKWHEFLATSHDIRSAKGAYLPTIELNANHGFETRNYGSNKEFNGSNVNLTLSQALYNGFNTRYQVQRYQNIHLVSYFELLHTVETTSLATFTAFQNVIRHRELVRLSRENFDVHKHVYAQIEQSAKAGVARRADFEQVNGRLALAESNLLTELNNLHDANAHYLRLVGELPPKTFSQPAIKETLLPATIEDVMGIALQSNPAFHATLRNIQAAKSSIQLQRSQYQPRLNLTARYGARDYDELGNPENRQDSRIGLEFSYNFYNGGRDQSNLKRAHEEINIANDLRYKSCIEIRQSLQITYNESRNLTQKLPILNQHRLSSNTVRTAYKAQFDIGQRTLLDMLNAENEFFQSSRAYTNAKFDQQIAIANTLTGMGQLLSLLNVTRSGLPTLSELGIEPLDVNPEFACPAIDISQIPE